MSKQVSPSTIKRFWILIAALFCASGTTLFIASPTIGPSKDARAPSSKAKPVRSYAECPLGSSRHKARSSELKKLADDDQADRRGSYIDWPTVAANDQARRKRVGEIFGEGCLVSGKDFTHAALIYQHGNVSDHFLQAFLWAKRAVELGEERQRLLMANGADRYLVSIGQKQLFATQAFQPSPTACFCLQQVEADFPDQRRKDVANWSLEKGFETVTTKNIGRVCNKATFCDIELKPTPQGFIPGIW